MRQLTQAEAFAEAATKIAQVKALMDELSTLAWRYDIDVGFALDDTELSYDSEYGWTTSGI